MEEKFKPIVCKSFFKSKFYQDITTNGEVIFSAETPDDLLRQRYEKFAKGRLLKSAIPDELKNKEAYSFFHKKMKMITTGYRLNGSVLLDFYKDNSHFALVFFENKGIAKIGRCSNDIGLYCLTSKNFKQRYSFSDRFINFFEIQLDNFWQRELLDPVKLCRNRRGFNKSLDGNKNLVRHLYFAIQHTFTFKELNKQERSILKCIGQYKGLVTER